MSVNEWLSKSWIVICGIDALAIYIPRIFEEHQYWYTLCLAGVVLVTYDIWKDITKAKRGWH